MPRIEISAKTFAELRRRALTPFSDEEILDYKKTSTIVVDQKVYEHLEGHRVLGEGWDDVVERLWNTHLIM